MRRSGCARSTSPRSVRTTGAGRPPRSRLSFPHATPEYFGDFAAGARALGARIIGGCCGTTPAQIAAIRQAVDEDRPARAAARARSHEPAAPPPADEEPTELARLLATGEFVVSVQLDPPLG